MIGFIAIEITALPLLLLLILQMIQKKIYYIKPILGLTLFIAFGASFVDVAAMHPSADLLSSLLISILGMIIGLGWVLEGLDNLANSKKGVK